MSLPKDFDPTLRPSQNFEMSPEEQALRQAQRTIENYVSIVELDSTRFKAYADYTDYFEASMGLNHNYDFDGTKRTERQREIRVGNIEETIRQRKNEIVGYRYEFAVAGSLALDLKEAYNNSRPNPQNENGLVRDLMGIKNTAINKRGALQYNPNITPQSPNSTS